MSDTSEPTWQKVLTPLGAKIMIGKPPEHLGAGVMMLLAMQDPADTRRAEVLLDKNAIDELIIALEKHQDL